MSTAPIDRGLYAVPAPPQQDRFALLLHLKRIARRAFDTLLALPRGAAGWVMRQAQRALSAPGANPALARIATRLRGLGDHIRSVGPIPAVAAVISIPAVWRATVRAARFLASKVAAGASTLWQRTHSLLMKLGPTGERIATTLASAGTVVRRLLVSVAVHPVTQTVGRGLTSLAALIRPLSHSVVVHRLLGRLVGASWLRWTIELLALPLVVAPALIADVSAGLRPPRSAQSARPGQERAGSEAAFGSAPDATAVPETEQSEEQVESDDGAASFEPRNRAERRAAQQAQPHAKRARARH